MRDITERKQAEEALLAHTFQIEAVRAVGMEITRELDLGALLGLIGQRAAGLVGAESGGSISGTRRPRFLRCKPGTAPERTWGRCASGWARGWQGRWPSGGKG
jgi:hypothetical protein